MQNKEFFCTDCGWLNPIGFSFCARCGKKFSYTCPDCDTEVSPGSQYCTSCGAELEWSILSGKTQTKALNQQTAVKPVEIKIARPRENNRDTVPLKQKKGHNSVALWIVLFALIIVAIVLLFNFELLFK